MRLVQLLLLAIIVAAPTEAAPSRGSTGSTAVLQRRLQHYVVSFARTGFFSGVVLVEQHGRPLLLRASGIAQREFNVPVDANTKFQIASLSKPITAAAIGRLVDQGKLTFETKVATIVPGIPNGDRITIEQLMTHYSGLDSPDREKGASHWVVFPQTTEQLVDRIRASKPIHEPGEKYEYSNANYWLLANIIERLSGVSYGRFLQREIFDPLGMKNTAHRGDLLKVVPLLAEGYQLDGANSYRRGDVLDWTSKTGNGSLYSTVGDYALFYDALVKRKLLSPQTTDRILGTGKRYGLSWFHRNPARFGRESVQYNGRSPGFGSYIEGFVNDDTYLIIMSNLYTYAPTAMSEGIADILWNKPYEEANALKLYPMNGAKLRSVEGKYKFGPDFHVPNGGVRVVAAGDHLTMNWDAGDRVTMLLPVGPDTFFDPTFWATINFERQRAGAVIHYRSLGFPKVYQATSITGG
jgi:CubicO group peptidase (beta-lactamase class C family)